MDDRQALIDEENEERLETGAPPIPGGSAEVRSHGGAVAAAIVAAVVAVLLVGLVAFAVFSVAKTRNTPTWVGSGNGGSNTTSAPSLSPQSQEDAAGRYYAFWKYEDDEIWGYVFDLYADGTGEFHLFLAEDDKFTPRLTARTTPKGSSGSRTAPWSRSPTPGARRRCLTRPTITCSPAPMATGYSRPATRTATTTPTRSSTRATTRPLPTCPSSHRSRGGPKEKEPGTSGGAGLLVFLARLAGPPTRTRDP